MPPKMVVQHANPGEHLVALFGDSITEGAGSSNYVDLLAERMGREGYRFLNVGVGGGTAFNLLNRLEPIVELHTDDIMILVGTNDLQAYLRGGYLHPIVQCMKKLPQAVTLEWYISTVRQMVQILQKDTRARIALCSIPPLGEDLDVLPNQRVRLFNGAIKALTDELAVAYLPVYETMEHFLRTHQQQPGQAFEESRVLGRILSVSWDHHIRGRSWDDISARNGLELQTDTIHFNRRGADITADLIEAWLHARAA
jgi:acyl-CoA thioesterase-1